QKRKGNWVPVHAADVIESLERDVFTTLGALPITRIEASQVLRTLRAVENRGAIETAHRLRQRISKIFEFAIAEGRAKFDPTSTLTSALETKPPSKRRPAVLTIEKARTVLNVLENAAASPAVKLANRFLALTAQRPGMVQKMEWADLHGDVTP
ncbi:MAG: integrase, partial [Novosphingobium sp.]|nr:integrase [Novosphingobium sp.]